ncbi:MAG: AMP-binding protein [Succinivibrio sp.]|nr:AMP-binding protein [Succinivibrio sp.]
MQPEDYRPWIGSYPEDVSADVNCAPYFSLNHLLISVCKTYSGRAAFESMGSVLTYRQLSRNVNALAAYLQKGLKLVKGDRVAIILPNILQYPVAVYGALRAGLIVVNINPLYTPREMQGVLKDSEAKAVITLDTCARSISEIQSETSVQHVIVTRIGDLLGPLKGFAVNAYMKHIKHMVPEYKKDNVISFKNCLKLGNNLTCDLVNIKLSDVAFFQYTGGTTGKPKGAMLTHGNIIANISQIVGLLGKDFVAGREVVLAPLPFYHIFALTVHVFYAISQGFTNIIVVDARRLPDIKRIIKRHPDLTLMTGVNTLFNAMISHNIVSRKLLPKLKAAIGGGASIQTGVAMRFKHVVGVPIMEGYGLTECSPVTCVNCNVGHDFNGTIGVPLPSTYARIINQQGEPIWDLDTPGELEFKGPQVMKGYFKNEEDNRKVRDGEWLRTGDIAVWKEGGYIKIIDRLKDMILVSGFNVFPSEIEDIVSRHAKVEECACIGVPSEATGEAIKLFIVRKDNSLTREEIIEYCRRFLTGYKLPKKVEFVPRLPKSPIGKVMRRYLRENRLTD